MKNNFANKTENNSYTELFDKYKIPADLPNAIIKSGYILFVTIALGLINTVILNHIKDGVLFSTPKMISVSIGIYGTMFYLFYMIRIGKNWARKLFLVLFILITILTLPDNINYVTNNSVIGLIAFTQTGLQFYALILLFNKESKDWYLTQKRESEAS